ncbi:hypothetical protein ACTXT7_015381, partial [Hymenolepis weldensis]
MGHNLRQSILRSSVSSNRSKTSEPLCTTPNRMGKQRDSLIRLREAYKKRKERELWKRSKFENDARGDAAEENSAGQEEGERKKNWFAVNTSVYARDYRLGRQWTAVIITKRHGSTIYDVVVGKDT